MGVAVGDFVGDAVGAFVSPSFVGADVGASVGGAVGAFVSPTFVGADVGASVGDAVGASVGDAVGASVGAGVLQVSFPTMQVAASRQLVVMVLPAGSTTLLPALGVVFPAVQSLEHQVEVTVAN